MKARCYVLFILESSHAGDVHLCSYDVHQISRPVGGFEWPILPLHDGRSGGLMTILLILLSIIGAGCVVACAYYAATAVNNHDGREFVSVGFGAVAVIIMVSVSHLSGFWTLPTF